MALKISPAGAFGKFSDGDLAYRVASLRLDSSYPTDGEAVTAANFGFTTLVAVVPLQTALPVYWDQANGKLKVYGIGAKGADTAATLVVDPAGANNSLTYTAARDNTAGNLISVEYTDPGAISQSLTVTVSDYRIIVSLATDGSGVITTTAAQVDAAIAANTDANALTACANTGGDTGAGLVTAMARAYLTGGASTGTPTELTNTSDISEGFEVVVLAIGLV